MLQPLFLFLFVYATSFYDERQIHVYEFNETREVDPESSYLKDFSGWVECDDYAGYDRLRRGRPTRTRSSDGPSSSSGSARKGR